MKKSIWYSLFIISLITACTKTDFETGEGIFTGINQLTDDQVSDIDYSIEPYIEKYKYLLIGIVNNGDVVLTRSYGGDKLDNREQYASVSKTVTANMCFQLWRKGLISSLFDPISDYDDKYMDAQPEEYSDPPINFIHLLTHTSGVIHLEDLWKKGKLNMMFSPGQKTEYSTKGFGILGDVMETITGEKYSRLVEEYISDPVNSKSFYTYPFVQTTPGAGVLSDIEDFALFAMATMNGTYFSREFLVDTVLQACSESPNGTIGLGWFVLEHQGRNLGYHAGSNGKPRAFILIDPLNESAVVLFGKNYEENARTDLHLLALNVLEKINEEY